MGLAQVATVTPDLRALFAQHGSPPLLGQIASEYYHGDRSCVSSSALKVMLRSPAHFLAYMSGALRKETPAMALGTAIHTRVLEPDQFALRYAVAPSSDRRTSEWKTFAAANVGKTLLTQPEAELLEGVARSIATHPTAAALLAGGHKEVSLIWQDEDTGLWLKARPDCLCIDYDTGICMDLKSTEDARGREFVRSCVTYDYDLSAALYLDGLRAVLQRDFDFMFLAAEKSPPYGRALYGAPEEMIERGRRRYKEALRRLRACLDTGNWPGYQCEGDYELLEWPRYAP